MLLTDRCALRQLMSSSANQHQWQDRSPELFFAGANLGFQRRNFSFVDWKDYPEVSAGIRCHAAEVKAWREVWRLALVLPAALSISVLFQDPEELQHRCMQSNFNLLPAVQNVWSIIHLFRSTRQMALWIVHSFASTSSPNSS